MRVAVIGAGISGLRVAQLLNADGCDVHVFDKARGPSGRLATRRSDAGSFDHGAQFFDARSERFKAQVSDWCARDVVAKWNARVVRICAGQIEIETDGSERYVGVPRMSAIARDMCNGLSTTFSGRVVRVQNVSGSFFLDLEGEESAGKFDLVISATPAPQAVPLLESSPDLARRAAAARLHPCHALMARFEAEPDCEFDAAYVDSRALAWVASNASKPGRAEAANWTLHSTPDWTHAHLEASPAEVRDALLDAFRTAVGKPLPELQFSATHRWLYSRADRSGIGEPLWDADSGLGACGDWVVGDRVEDAFLSAEHLVAEIKAR